ncbi:type 1 glutamine amidotransferase [Mariniluteicoccus endophyticus]
MSLEIVLVYQSLLGIYGDQGNAKVLLKRALWRGIDATLTTVEPGQPLPDSGDIFLLGGGEDGAQTSAVRELTKDGGLHRAADRGAVVFAVCAGYQILGHTFGVGDADELRAGLGLLDVTTTRGPLRAVGEVLHRWTGPGAPSGDEAYLTGFENHGGYTHLGADATPLATREIGVGNDDSGTEGAVQGTVIGTYPHGPILPRNPALADHLLELALGHEIDPLPNANHDELRRRRIAWVREHGR